MVSKKIITFILIFSVFVGNLQSQVFENGYYRLTTQWQGEGKSLDVVNDGTNNKLQLAKTDNASGQMWKITNLGNGYYRLTTQWQGEGKSLDVVNDGTNNKLQLAKTDNASGQMWKITDLGNGYYRLTTQWQGEGKSLDVVNDGTNNKLQLAKTDNASGQMWKVTLLTKQPKVVGSNTLYRYGFKIILNVDTLSQPESQEALNVLTQKLKEITQIVKPSKVEMLQKIPIWVEYELLKDKAMWYNKSKEWLLENGYNPEKAKCVEILNVKNFLSWQKLNQPYMVLHELAHGYHDIFLKNTGYDIKVTNTYKEAVKSRKYESVSYGLGGTKKAYAIENEDEYFAEITEAYFGKNDYYPYNRAELKNFDAKAFLLMQDVWE